MLFSEWGLYVRSIFAENNAEKETNAQDIVDMFTSHILLFCHYVKKFTFSRYRAPLIARKIVLFFAANMLLTLD